MSQDDTNALNARHGEEYAICTKAAVLDLLRRSGVDAAAFACAWAVADDDPAVADDDVPVAGDHVRLADDRLPLADDDLGMADDADDHLQSCSKRAHVDDSEDIVSITGCIFKICGFSASRRACRSPPTSTPLYQQRGLASVGHEAHGAGALADNDVAVVAAVCSQARRSATLRLSTFCMRAAQ